MQPPTIGRARTHRAIGFLRERIAPAHASGSLPLAAVLLGNVMVAFGPWFVRLADVGPSAAGFWRVALAAPVLTRVAWPRGAALRRVEPRLLAIFATAGLFFAGDLAVWHVGLRLTRLANAALLGNSAAFLFPVYGFVIARSWPNRLQVAALVLGASGGVILLGRSYKLDANYFAGDLLCFLGGPLYIGYLLCMVRVGSAMRPVPALACATLASAPPLLASALIAGEVIVPGNWWPLAALALTNQVLGQALLMYGLSALSPLVIGLTMLAQPLIASLVGWLAYGEQLHRPDVVAAALISVSLVLVRQSKK